MSTDDYRVIAGLFTLFVIMVISILLSIKRDKTTKKIDWPKDEA